jgi:hypothetical protein
MPVTDARSHDEAPHRGLSPATWAIILTAVAIGVGYLLGAQAWVKPNWHRWWLPILVLEVFVYSLTLIIPPVGRLSVPHGALRVVVGMGMRLVVVLANAAFGLRGGSSSFLANVQAYWAGRWPAAIGEIACVAIAVYWFRYLSLQRVQRAKAPAQDAAPAVLDPAKRPREALVDELTGRGREEAGSPSVPLPEPKVPDRRFRKPISVVETVARPSAPKTTAPPPEPDLAETRVPVVPPSPQPAVAEGISAALTTVRLPAEVVVRSLPETILAEPVDALAPQLAAVEVSFPWEVIAPQLGEGEVWVDATAVLEQLPQTVLSEPVSRCAEQLREGVTLPLAEIVMRIPPEAFAPPPDQEPGAELPSGSPIFREAGSPPAVPSTAYVAPAPTAPAPTIPSIALPVPEPSPEPIVPEGPPPIAVREPTPGPEAPREPPGQAAPNVVEEQARRERALAAAISALQRPARAEPAKEEMSGRVAEQEPESEPAAAFTEPDEEVAPEEARVEEPEPEVAAGDEVEPESVAASAGRDEESLVLPESSVAGTLFAFPAGWSADESPEEDGSKAVAVLTEPVEEEAPEELEPEVVAEEEAESELVAAPVELDQESLPVAESSVVGTLAAPPEAVPLATVAESAAQAPLEVLEPEPVAVAGSSEPTAEPAIREPEFVTADGTLLDSETEKAILGSLRGVGILRLDLVFRDGLTVVVADGSERVDGAFDLAEGVLALARASGGHLGFALVTGAQGATFVGGTDQASGVYLVVAGEGASAGQVSVAARKAVVSLAQLSSGAPYVPSTPPAASEDPALAAVADEAAENASGGFRAPSGSGVMVFGFGTSGAAVLASAAAAAWNAAKVSQPGRLDKVLLVASNRTLAVSVSAEASALVVAAFEPGINLGLAGAALTKLVKACDQAAGRGGLWAHGQ